MRNINLAFEGTGKMHLTPEQKKAIQLEEYEFPKLFTNYHQTGYGILFYNEENKESYDSNHAVIYPEHIDNLAHVLKEITAFYKAKAIVPSVFHPFTADYFAQNEHIFEEQGFQIMNETSNRVAVLSDRSRIIPNGQLDIRKLTQWDKRLTEDILIPNGEPYEAVVGEATIKHNGSHLFAGYKGNKAVVYILLHVSPFGCTRFDYINTAKDQRGLGYARQIIHQAVNFCREASLPLCATWFANSTSERLSYEAGFRLTDLCLESGYAVYNELGTAIT